MTSTETVSVVEQLKTLDRDGLLRVRSEVTSLLMTSVPNGVFERYRVPAVGGMPARTYDLMRVRCGRKKKCRRCSEGEYHGPYWYCFWAGKNGKRMCKYAKRDLPPEILAIATKVDLTKASDDEPLETTALPTRKNVGRRVFRRKA